MNRYEQTRRVAIMGIIANIILLAFKLSAGFLTRSQAMIADGFNSAGDVFASIMTYAGNRISNRPEDSSHPYGYGKAEYVFSMMISFSLLLVAYKIFTGSLSAIFHGEKFIYSAWLLIISIVTIIAKTVMFIYTKSIGRKFDNLLVVANSEDHRNDIIVTSSALLGIILSSTGFSWFDGAAGIGISVWIAFTAIRIFLNSYHVLMDKSIDKVLKADLQAAVRSVSGVEHVDDITAKPVGVAYILIVKVSVPGNLSVFEGHGVAARIKEKLIDFNGIRDVVVHINPA